MEEYELYGHLGNKTYLLDGTPSNLLPYPIIVVFSKLKVMVTKQSHT